MLFDSQPSAFTAFANSFLGSSLAVRKLTVHGKPLGKLDKISDIKDIRLVLPQGSLMSILDVLLATSLDDFIDKVFREFPTTTCSSGQGRRRKYWILLSLVKLLLKRQLTTFQSEPLLNVTWRSIMIICPFSNFSAGLSTKVLTLRRVNHHRSSIVYNLTGVGAILATQAVCPGPLRGCSHWLQNSWCVGAYSYGVHAS